MNEPSHPQPPPPLPLYPSLPADLIQLVRYGDYVWLAINTCSYGNGLLCSASVYKEDGRKQKKLAEPLFLFNIQQLLPFSAGSSRAGNNDEDTTTTAAATTAKKDGVFLELNRV